MSNINHKTCLSPFHALNPRSSWMLTVHALLTQLQTFLNLKAEQWDVCICASPSSDDKQPIRFPGGKAQEEGKAVGSGCQKQHKIIKVAASYCPRLLNYCLIHIVWIFFPILCKMQDLPPHCLLKCCQEWTYYELACAWICAYRRVLSLCLVEHGGL